MERVLLTGAQGQLGAEFKEYLSKKALVFSYDRSKLDITDTSLIEEEVLKIRPKILINCAAYTKVDDAETEEGKQRADIINNRALAGIVKLCKKYRIKLVHFSTDYVFDGLLAEGEKYDENSLPNPLNQYGHSKLLGDNEILSDDGENLVIRVAWLTGTKGSNYVSKMIEFANKFGSLKVVNDQIGTPSFCHDVVQKTWSLIQSNAKGLYNVCSKDSCNRYDFTKEFLRMAGILDGTNIEAVTTASFNSKANRPLNTPLDVSKLEEELEAPQKSWITLLSEHMSLLNKTGE